MDGTTLLYSQPTWPGVEWHDSGESLRRVESFDYVKNLMKRPRMGDPIERIIIEAPVDGSQFMLFLTQLPSDFLGDVLYIDRADRGILSAATDDSPRVLYSLEETDINFYAMVNRLTRKSFQPRAVPAPVKHEQMRVLLAEDEPRTREILTEILTKLGCRVTVAVPGLDALRKTHEERPNVLLLDGLMPEMHGFEVARCVRSIEASYRPRIVVLTAVYKNTRYQNEARMKYGVDGYLVKPVTPEQIGDAVFGSERNQSAARIAAAS